MADARPRSKKAPEPPLEAAAEAGAKDTADKPPAPPPQRKRRVTKKTTAAIERALSEILTMPAAPAAIRGELSDDDRYRWLAGHFTQRGPELAKQIAIASEKNDTLRIWCERIIDGETWGMLIVAAIAYAYPVAAFYEVLPRIPIGGSILGEPPPKAPAPEPSGNGAGPAQPPPPEPPPGPWMEAEAPETPAKEPRADEDVEYLIPVFPDPDPDSFEPPAEGLGE